MLINPFKKIAALIVVCGTMILTLAGCASSLPEGASAPQLKVESVSLVNDQSEPYFIVNYSVEHRSLSDLPLQKVRASIFIRNTLVAITNQDTQGVLISNQGPQQLQVKVPVNISSKAAFDSLANSSLLMLEGSCALTLIFTEDPELKSFNPSSSYSGFIGVSK